MGLEYKCLKGMIAPTIHIDEFSSKMGDDDDVLVASFYVTDEQAAKDLVGWFEKGYQFILDADRSPGEINPNKYLVYVEMKRRSNIGDNLSTMLEDLSTLCELESVDWKFRYGKQEQEFTTEQFEKVVPTSPKAYRLDKELGLNEVRSRAGLATKRIYENDKEIQKLKDIANLK
jgi:hypothetical protein